MNKRSFELKFGDKVEKFDVRIPSAKQLREAQNVWAAAFSDAVARKYILREKVEDVLREQGIWNKEKENKMREIATKIAENEKLLTLGRNKNFPEGIRKGKHGVNDKSTAYGVALETRILRNELILLRVEQQSLDSSTAQGHADEVRMNYLISVATVYNETGKPVFSSFDEFLDNSVVGVGDDRLFKIAYQANIEFQKLYYKFNEDAQKEQPENKFLIKYSFVDDKLRLVDKNNNLIDGQGNRVNEDGFVVNDKNQMVDRDGTPFDDKGNYIADTVTPFLDEEKEPKVSGKKKE